MTNLQRKIPHPISSVNVMFNRKTIASWWWILATSFTSHRKSAISSKWRKNNTENNKFNDQIIIRVCNSKAKNCEITQTLYRATAAKRHNGLWLCRLSMPVYVVVKVSFVIADNMMLLNPLCVLASPAKKGHHSFFDFCVLTLISLALWARRAHLHLVCSHRIGWHFSFGFHLDGGVYLMCGSSVFPWKLNL